MKLIINGAGGRMGQTLLSLIASSDKYDLAASCSMEFDTDRENNIYKNIAEFDGEADCIIDFSHHSVTPSLVEFAVNNNLPLVMATTGHDLDEVDIIKEASKKIPIFYSRNMSLGINLLLKMLKDAAAVLGPAGYDIEIVEKHHNLKIDAPSGTALALADSINEEFDNSFEYVYDRSQVRQKRTDKEIGISAVRGGTIVGDHEVIFAGTDEVIEFKHTAYSKAVFGKGAVQAAKFLAGKPAGLYNMGHVIENA